MEQVLTFAERFKDKNMRKMLGIIALALIVVAVIGGTIFRLSETKMVPIYNNLETKDSGDIIAELEARSVPFELRANGSQILVPETKMLRLRMILSEKGLPTKGGLVGYEIFDQSETLGTSSFIQNVNLLRALEGELARTIASFAQIATARVHLVMPKRELFTKDRQEPTASVMLGMRGSKGLTREEIHAISHLVATAVPGLNVSKITIVDTKGRAFKLGAEDTDDPGVVANTNTEYRQNYEKHLQTTLEDLLGQSLGANKVKVHVTADLNFDRVVTNSETYDPDGQVVRSVQSEEEHDASKQSNQDNNVSVATNLPNSTANNVTDNNVVTNDRTSETTNYEITKVVKNQIMETGTIKKLSIAVLVDGQYKIDAANGTVTYIPRAQEELDKVGTLVKSAVGFHKERGDMLEVVNMQFDIDMDALKPQDLTHWLKEQFASIAQTLIIASVIVLVIVLVIRPVAIRAFELTRGELDQLTISDLSVETMPEDLIPAKEKESAKLEEESMIDIEKVSSQFRSGPIKSINEFMEKHPNEALVVLRRWLNDEDKM
jgi:flagellar M-ring protein FliF